MAGAIIPDDWDGVSFNCQRVWWPSSVQWRAILAGQITEPGNTYFWDEDTGEEEDAAQAVLDAEDLTSPDFWTGECDMIPGHPVVAFLAYPSSLLILTLGSYVPIRCNVLKYGYNNPGYDISDWSHKPLPEGHEGIWHYDVQAHILPQDKRYSLRARIPSRSLTIARHDSKHSLLQLSFDYDWNEGGDKLVIEAWTNTSATVQSGRYSTFFSGHYLGEVS